MPPESDRTSDLLIGCGVTAVGLSPFVWFAWSYFRGSPAPDVWLFTMPVVCFVLCLLGFLRRISLRGMPIIATLFAIGLTVTTTIGAFIFMLMMSIAFSFAGVPGFELP